jgi:4-hydroxybenzoate polyprenyltransferase
VVAVAAVSGFLAVVAGRGPGTVWVVLAVLAGQLFVGWTNDYLDRNLDRAEHRADKPLAGGGIEPRAVAIAAIAALAAAVPLSLASGVAAALVHLAGLASATAYNLRLKATVFSAVPYALSFSLVPAFITLGLTPSHWPPLWVMVAAGLIGLGGHFAQARPDVERDRRQRVLGLPQLVGDRGSAVLAAVLLAAGAVVIAAATRNPLPLVVIVPAAGVAITRPKLAFWLTLATAGLATLVFVVVAGRSLR